VLLCLIAPNLAYQGEGGRAMKILAMTTIWAVAVTSAQGKGKIDKQSVVTVYIQFASGDLSGIRAQAEGVASEILSQAGVYIRWRPGEPKVHQEKQPILIDVTSETRSQKVSSSPATGNAS
jgi:hypothetical protein